MNPLGYDEQPTIEVGFLLPGAVSRAAFSYTTTAFSSTFLAEMGQNGTPWTAFSSTLGGVFFHLAALKPSAGAGCSVGNTLILRLRIASHCSAFVRNPLSSIRAPAYFVFLGVGQECGFQ